MSTCCSSGKARIYFYIPTKGGLKYKLKNSNKWQTILTNEPSNSTCIINENLNRQYLVRLDYSCSTKNRTVNNILWGPLEGKILFREKIEYSNSGMALYLWQYSFDSGINWTYSGCHTRRAPENEGDIDILSGYSLEIDLIDDPKPKKFTVTGTETGTKYLEIEVDECPDVQTIPCKFDPAKEQYIDVDTPIGDEFVESCFEITNYTDPYGAEATRVLNIKTVLKDNKTPPNLPEKYKKILQVTPTNLTLLVLDVSSPKGCPPPKVRVECCPKGICGEDKKCPKGTTCEIVCNGFKCCYRNGKLIRSIKL